MIFTCISSLGYSLLTFQQKLDSTKRLHLPCCRFCFVDFSWFDRVPCLRQTSPKSAGKVSKCDCINGTVGPFHTWFRRHSEDLQRVIYDFLPWCFEGNLWWPLSNVVFICTECRGAQIFQKSSIRLKFLRARRVTKASSLLRTDNFVASPYKL